MRSAVWIIALTALFLFQPLAMGQDRFIALASGAEEVPPVVTDTRAVGIFALLGRETILLDLVLAVNLVEATAAHIHCARVGTNGPVGVTLYSGDPVTIPGGLFDLGVATEPDAANGCGWLDLDDVVAALRSGDTYLNIHTRAHPSGEVRGQIRPLGPTD